MGVESRPNAYSHPWFRGARADTIGADPAGSAELALRAEQLSSRAERARIADALLEILGREPMTFLPRPQRAVVRAAADEIIALVLRLRDERPAGIAGVAAAARLADDRRGPMYRDDAGDLDDAIRSALSALDPIAERTGESTRKRRDQEAGRVRSSAVACGMRASKPSAASPMR